MRCNTLARPRQCDPWCRKWLILQVGRPSVVCLKPTNPRAETFPNIFGSSVIQILLTSYVIENNLHTKHGSARTHETRSRYKAIGG